MAGDDHGAVSILCTRRLWRLVKSTTFPERRPMSTAARHRLGPWAGTISKEDERTLILAMDLGTALTLAFVVADVADLHDRFAEALGSALEDLQVPPEAILLETAAVKRLPVRPLSDASLRERLETVDFVLGIELSYATDLRIVQRRLNEFPHDLPPHYVPAVAARSLLTHGTP
jgi:hypothetical protein